MFVAVDTVAQMMLSRTEKKKKKGQPVCLQVVFSVRACERERDREWAIDVTRTSFHVAEQMYAGGTGSRLLGPRKNLIRFCNLSKCSPQSSWARFLGLCCGAEAPVDRGACQSTDFILFGQQHEAFWTKRIHNSQLSIGIISQEG